MKEPGVFGRIKSNIKEFIYGPEISDEPRLIYLDGKVHPENKTFYQLSMEVRSFCIFLKKN